MAIKKQLLRLSRLLLFSSVLCMFTTILTASLNFGRYCVLVIDLQMGGVNVQIFDESETHEYAGMVTVVKRSSVNIISSECHHTSGWDAYGNCLRQIWI